MRREFAVVMMLSFVATPALAAASRCNPPYAPHFRDGGAGATRQGIMSMRDDAQTFIAASDIYQACLLKSGLQQDAKVRIEANQREKLRVGNAYKAAVAAYKGAQKGTAPALDDLEIVFAEDDD